MHTATYSPEDNKLRLYPESRLSPEDYAAVRAVGFIWAPKQELFVAPMWTPSREDFLMEMCEEIGDEDTSLVERAEAKAERLENLSERKAREGDRAEKTVSAITEHIPFGQPILIGHHSEKRARKNAEKIQNGMRKAVDNWKAAEYWLERAKGSIRLAKYKERPDVRYRRIKGLESDKRKQEKYIEERETILRLWTACEAEQNKEAQLKMAIRIAGTYNLGLARKEGDREEFQHSQSAYGALTNSHPTLYASRTIEDVFRAAQKAYPRSIADCRRWLAHYENRIAYERAMLDEGGGIAAKDFVFRIGGRVLAGGEWATITKLNKKDGAICSVTTNARYCRIKSLEEIKDYEAPSQEQMEAVQAATKTPPMCNYPGEGFATCTEEQWKKINSDYKGSKWIEATETAARHRVRWAIGLWLTLPPLPEGKDSTERSNQRHSYYRVFVTDAKRKDAPPAELIKTPTPAIQPAHRDAMSTPRQIEPQADRSKLEAMQQTLKAGVQVVSAPQLFPTPPELARRMVEIAEIEPDHRVLEPSAGTGALLRAIGNQPDKVAVEINGNLVRSLMVCGLSGLHIHEGDFLEQNGNLGKFERILMNPPFVNGEDIKHIQHARKFLKPGGLLVAICAGGPRQEAQLQPIAETWERLPEGTFKDQGTSVNTVLLTVRGE